LVPDRYNIVGDIELNNLELAKMVAEILGKELKYEFVDFHKGRSGHDRRYALSGDKLKSLGWKAPLSFRESLEHTIKWTLERPEWL
jgi:dTDP-glucose 4,6-dehydratase